tara:strand:+ start:1037 stop:1753 length:717 start_codon:yes stop_codon:yes gene_type:complete
MRERTSEEQRICDEAVVYVKGNKRKLIDEYVVSKPAHTDGKPIAIFMAGSPGAGKTEFAETFLNDINGDDIVFVDPDALRKIMPGYGGANAHLFQKAVSRLVNEMYSAVLKDKRSFLLDGTMSSYNQAQMNIERALKKGYDVYIFYVYQDPVSAWKFTQAREKTEGRRIWMQTFIQQFFAAAEVVNRIKINFAKDVVVHLIIKDIFNGTKKFETNVQGVDSYIKHTYTKDTLERLLNC